ncbi:MAG TPA: efflux transporter outer membrane subunit [Vicinamibacterales bacterium]|jgi:NodT family efflux transporter outer membrane factor (OMF) lipoprotein
MTRRFVAPLVVAATVVAGCNVGPPYQRPQLPEPAPSQYKENQPGSQEAQSNGWRPANPQDAMIRGKWWDVFGDAELNALEEQVLVNNQTIKQSFENYMAALAVIDSARATQFPTVSVGLNASASGSNGASSATTVTGTGGAPTSAAVVSSGTRHTVSLPVSASWEPDLFGKVRNTIEANVNAAQVSAATLANETLSQQATLAETYFELRGQDSLQALFAQTVSDYQESLRLTQTLYRTGIDSEQDVAQAETALRTAEANATAVERARAQFEHAIALLTGHAAGSFSVPVRALDATPPQVPTGVPSQLLERRPDIAGAERAMAEANARIGVGKAAYYPDVSLIGSAGIQSSSVVKLLSASMFFWSLGGSAAQTVLDFGARRAAVRQFEAEYNASVANYRETVLNAFKEVEDDLAATRTLADQTARQQLAVTASQRYQQLASIRYRDGLDNYLNVLTAQNSVFTSLEAMVGLQTDRMTTAVQLIVALGGGWDVSDLPAPATLRAIRR